MKRLLILAALLFSACFSGPGFDYDKLMLPSAFSASGKYNHSAPSPLWWRGFKDPLLNRLIKIAGKNNYDIAIAGKRIAQSRLNSSRLLWDLYMPPVVVEGNYNKNKTSAARMPFIREDQYLTTEFYQAGASVLWELDLWGGSREAYRGALAEEVAAAAAAQDAFVSVSAEVANNYFTMAATRSRLNLARQRMKVSQQLEEIAKAKYEAGSIDLTNYLIARNNTLSATATVLQLKSEVKVYENAVKFLCVKLSPRLQQRLRHTASLPDYQGPLSIGNPQKWLRARPDLRVAEAQMVSASAAVGVALSDLLPAVGFQGSFGYAAQKIGDIGSKMSEAYSIVPQLTWNLFDLPLLIQKKRIASREFEVQALLYQKTVLAALHEVDNSLGKFGTERNRFQLLSRYFENQQRIYEVSQINEKAGRSSSEKTLNSQNALLTVKEQQLLSYLALNQNLTFLHKALGGGWSN